MARTTSSYRPDGTIDTTMERSGVDIGPVPDFWGDVEDVYNRLRPVPAGGGGMGTARQQAGALAGRGRSAGPMTQRTTRDYRSGGSASDFAPYFGTLTYPHGSAGFYQNYQPGMPLGTGQQPVAMGTVRGGRR